MDGAGIKLNPIVRTVRLAGMNVTEILIETGYLTSEQVASLPGPADDVSGNASWEQLRHQGILNDARALDILGQAFGLRVVDLPQVEVDPSLLRFIPQRILSRGGVFPISLCDGELCVAISDPMDIGLVDELRASTQFRIDCVLARFSDVQQLLKRHFGVGRDTVDRLINQRGQSVSSEPESESETQQAEFGDEASVVRLVNEFLAEAIAQRASDVHIESERSGIRIRFRIDGVLHRQPVPPEIAQLRGAIISRLKIMANLNIAEKRLAQDGRMRMVLDGKDVDVRISVIPMLHGEGVVLRLLDNDAMQFDPRQLGMSQSIYQAFERIIRRPHGIVLVTGPTGSGKTTTLYSALMSIRNESTKFITIEDPIEYDLEGISQIQVHEHIGRTFAAGLRNILRHDPDVIFVGEIRDVETAEVAIQSALTGHLVFSTLHTNDAAGAFVRLVDMGIEPYLVTSTLEAVIAQRLVRQICNHCKEPYRPDPDSLPVDFPRHDDLTLYIGRGCRHCHGLGFYGRSGIFELLPTSESIHRLVLEGKNADSLRAQAARDGMVSLRDDGWRKVLAGETTVDEVMRVTKSE